eukprot:TRINITY_DN8584_c1_g3_i1.p1 TRINITY_DN8584_c1_g3~~TRINITY_DN8584_c1_g3_i1.p1  ORF type:complete len:512 (+),score=70.51 TRINITY_DN8584_c1_g3_i1:779-2314(+)
MSPLSRMWTLYSARLALLLLLSTLTSRVICGELLESALAEPLVTTTPPSLETGIQPTPDLRNGRFQNGSFRNAYVTSMYCGTARDYEFHVASRVLFFKLRRMSPQADLVVLLSSDCPSTWLQTYQSDGLIVKIVHDVANPYTGQRKFNRRFIFTLNKLYAWSLYEYERVVMLDVDNIFLRNADELFQCGDFCAVFINPCIFHTGLFVVKPSNETFNKMLRDVGRIKSGDGGDQGFLVSAFPDLLNAPIFRPPQEGLPALEGNFRLPFGYQMDTSYYYFRLSWHVPCSSNAVITFPGAQLLKPWYWWSWPLLPLGFQWHEERRASIGYSHESPVILSLLITYLLLLATAPALRARSLSTGEQVSILSLFCPNRKPVDSRFCPKCPSPSWLQRALLFVYLTIAIFAPFFLVPPLCHSLLGWSLYFIGVLSLLSLPMCAFPVPWLPALTPWLLLLLNWMHMALPLYRHGFPRFLGIGLLAFVCSPVLWWSVTVYVRCMEKTYEYTDLYKAQAFP